MKKIILTIVDALPPGIRGFLKRKRSEIFRNKIIAKWRENGSPVPPPHEIKQLALIEYGKKYNCKTLVETGTFMGDMIEVQRFYFDKLYSIELSHELWMKATKRFRAYKNIEILEGDSGIKLKEIIGKLPSNTLFWLDGHYSFGVTAQGDLNCPIYAELDTILSCGKSHVIIIDDAREFVGREDYPTIEELKKYVENKNMSINFEVKDDLIRLTPNN